MQTTFEKYRSFLIKKKTDSNRLKGIVRLSMKEIRNLEKEREFNDTVKHNLLGDEDFKGSKRPYKHRKSIQSPEKKRAYQIISHKTRILPGSFSNLKLSFLDFSNDIMTSNNKIESERQANRQKMISIVQAKQQTKKVIKMMRTTSLNKFKGIQIKGDILKRNFIGSRGNFGDHHRNKTMLLPI